MVLIIINKPLKKIERIRSETFHRTFVAIVFDSHGHRILPDVKNRSTNRIFVSFLVDLLPEKWIEFNGSLLVSTDETFSN